MTRALNGAQANLTIAQLVEKAKHSTAPVEIRVRDAKMVVVVLLQQDYEQLQAIRKAEKIIVTRPSKTPSGYLAETERALHRYKKKYRMTSVEFYRRFQAGALDESQRDYFDWRVTYNAHRRLKKRAAHG